MVVVPEEFKPVQNVIYPPGNILPFERYFDQEFSKLNPNTFREYLPIHWTAYCVNSNYGGNKIAMDKLQKFIDSLDKSKKYFSIIQNDDGILNDVSGIDLLVYSMGCGKPGYYPIPLISQPLNCQRVELHEKDILYSFFGINTHPIRERLVRELNNEYVKLESIPIDKYYDILKRSVFAICPRGYGITSFRLYESLFYSCIPIYVSDKFWEAFNIPFDIYGIKITENQIKDIPNILKNINIPNMQEIVKQYYEKYFTYQGCFNSIIKTLTV